jgi:hypothetical protein
MKPKFIYHLSTSTLYAPDGKFLKTVLCPRAKQWDQLLRDDPTEKSKKCFSCGDRVINLDKLSLEESAEAFSRPSDEGKLPCIFASSQSENVVFIESHDTWDLTNEGPSTHKDLPVIQTVRTMDEIIVAPEYGFWPDVHWVEFNTFDIRAKLQIDQHPETGEVDFAGDYRHVAKRYQARDGKEREYETKIPFRDYYPAYQRSPVAAYLIPKDLPDGSKVIVADPIQDIVGWAWNQGDTRRAYGVPGIVENRQVRILINQVEPPCPVIG